MNFAFTEEQEELRKTVRAFLDAKSSEEAVREQMETEDGYDTAVWSQMAEQMGLQGLHIPEEFGGSGFGYVELGIVLEEMGRSLLCAPFFSSVVLAANTLIQSGDDAAKQAYLPGIASGETIATLAYTEPSGKWDESGITCQATKRGDGYTLNGTKSFVLDGHTANLIIVAAKTDAGTSLFAVDGDAAGLTRTSLSTMDQTRKQAKLEFADTPATLIGEDGKGWDTLTTVLDLAAVGLAAEQVGGAQKVLEMAVEYAKVRVQFGRPIGSFQAIKHKCADMLLEVESAKSAAYYGMWCASEMNDELPVDGLARQGVLLGGVLPRRRREHPDPRWHRLHLGAPGAPVLQAGQELRAPVRRPDVPPRAARPAHRHLIERGALVPGTSAPRCCSPVIVVQGGPAVASEPTRLPHAPIRRSAVARPRFAAAPLMTSAGDPCSTSTYHAWTRAFWSAFAFSPKLCIPTMTTRFVPPVSEILTRSELSTARGSGVPDAVKASGRGTGSRSGRVTMIWSPSRPWVAATSGPVFGATSDVAYSVTPEFVHVTVAVDGRSGMANDSDQRPAGVTSTFESTYRGGVSYQSFARPVTTTRALPGQFPDATVSAPGEVTRGDTTIEGAEGSGIWMRAAFG